MDREDPGRDAERHHVLRGDADRRSGWYDSQPHAEHCGSRKSARENRIARVRALAFRIRNDCREPAAGVLHSLESFHGTRRGDHENAGCHRRPARDIQIAVISVSEASARILAQIAALPGESVATENAIGLVLASNVTAPLTSPPW